MYQSDSAIQCVTSSSEVYKGNPKWMEESERTRQIRRFLYYDYQFSFRNYRLAKVLFIHCFYIVVGIVLPTSI